MANEIRNYHVTKHERSSTQGLGDPTNQIWHGGAQFAPLWAPYHEELQVFSAVSTHQHCQHIIERLIYGKHSNAFIFCTS